jgi:hypothetical protein
MGASWTVVVTVLRLLAGLLNSLLTFAGTLGLLHTSPFTERHPAQVVVMVKRGGRSGSSSKQGNGGNEGGFDDRWKGVKVKKTTSSSSALSKVRAVPNHLESICHIINNHLIYRYLLILKAYSL